MHMYFMSVCLFDVCDLSVKCILNEKKNFEMKSLRLENRTQRTSCREILFKAVFCEMVRTNA